MTPRLRFLTLTSLCALPVLGCAPRAAWAGGQLSPTLRDATLQEQLRQARRDMTTIAGRGPSLWGESPLWSHAPLHAADDGSVTQGEFMNAMADQMATLGQVREWRATVRGRDRFGARAKQRSFKLGAPRLGKKAKNAPSKGVALQLGAQALPQWGLASFGGMSPDGAATASVVKWGRVQAGSTEPMLALNRAFKSYDTLMENQTAAADTETPKLTWLQARAVENKTSSLDLIAARGSRALMPGAAPNTNPTGTVWGGRGQMALFPQQLKNWNLRGEWLGSRLEGQKNSAQSWNVNVDGPVEHPFGAARVSAGFVKTDPGFAPFSDPSAQVNAQNPEKRTRGQVVVAQDAKLHLPVGLLLTGTASVTAARSERKNLEQQAAEQAELASRQTKTDEVTGTADLRLQVLPRIAMTGRHTRGFLWEDRPDAPQLPENFTDRNDSDAGVELKVSRSLALTAGVGQTRIGNAALPPDAVIPLSSSLRDEERITVGIQKRTGGGAWNLSVARRELENNTLDGSPFEQGAGDGLAHTLNLSAERRLFSWLNLQGGWSWNNEDTYTPGTDGAISPATLRSQSRMAQAQISLPFRSRFDVRYQEYLQQRAAGGASALLPGATREYGARYCIGAQEGQAGMGLAVEYARREVGNDPLNTWRVGLTYR